MKRENRAQPHSSNAECYLYCIHSLLCRHTICFVLTPRKYHCAGSKCLCACRHVHCSCTLYIVYVCTYMLSYNSYVFLMWTLSVCDYLCKNEVQRSVPTCISFSLFDRKQGCTIFCRSTGQLIDLIIIMNLSLSLWVNHTVHMAVILSGDAVTTASVDLIIHPVCMI